MQGVIVGVFLLAHGLIHASYLVPAPQPPGGWPFTIGDSWLVRRSGVSLETLRASVTLLVATVVVSFAVGAASVLGHAPVAWFAPAAVVGAVASVVLLVAMFHRYLLIGFVIDAAVIRLVLVEHWTPQVIR